ncbi:phosphopyruvate hydratase [Streptomyces endophyticus]|uniref:Enolase n=1 Tax=Streptomyces endophyticus TaxID=714166 RepID=A0ABU6FD60_9ACTN|nr:enolase C-terminal domain-like protein [Streptomyces endophyticus]MEB8340737.1 phosphopyruvate hydratase [Streptomyces endophyticus]
MIHPSPLTSISAVTGHPRWDSRGRPTVEVVVRTGDGSVGRALAPAGASTGSGEAVDLRDGGPAHGGYGVDRAVDRVNGPIAAALKGLDAADQAGADAALEAADGTAGFAHLGGNATVATSLAVAQAAAAASGLPLWRALNPAARRLPLPEVQIFGGGAHAHGRLDVQDLMVVPYGAGSFAEAYAWCNDVYRAAGELLDRRGARAGVADEGGWWPAFDSNEAALSALTEAIEAAGRAPGDEIGISLDIAATQLADGAGGYLLRREERRFDRDGWCELLLGWLDRYPVVSIEDPFAEDDPVGMAALTTAVAGRVQVIGDDFLVTDAARVHSAADTGACTAVLVKPNQAGTLTRARAALDAAHARGLTAIVSARSGETEDVAVAHLAVGWGSGGVKVGSVTRGERTAKWNELLRIEEELGVDARFAGRSGLGLDGGPA